jgi:hypothetical protein
MGNPLSKNCKAMRGTDPGVEGHRIVGGFRRGVSSLPGHDSAGFAARFPGTSPGVTVLAASHVKQRVRGDGHGGSTGAEG